MKVITVTLHFVLDRKIFWHEESPVQRRTWYLQEIPHKNDKNLRVPQSCRGKWCSAESSQTSCWSVKLLFVTTLANKQTALLFCCSKWVLTEGTSLICLRSVQTRCHRKEFSLDWVRIDPGCLFQSLEQEGKALGPGIRAWCCCSPTSIKHQNQKRHRNQNDELESHKNDACKSKQPVYFNLSLMGFTDPAKTMFCFLFFIIIVDMVLV